MIFIGYNKNTEVRYELLLDGITGEIIDMVMEPMGDKRYSSRADVMENGVSLLPEGMSASVYTRHWGDALWISLYDENNSEYTGTYLVLYADGENRLVTLPAESDCVGIGNYLFYPSYADEYETGWGYQITPPVSFR